MEIIIKHKKDIPSAAKKLLRQYKRSRIFAFDGPMGAGKTTIIKAACSVLGATDITTSPTFTIVNEYQTRDSGSIFHIDLYRIKNIEEAYDLGIEEYLSSAAWCFLEWPGIIRDILPAETIFVSISVGDNEERMLLIS